MLKLTLRPGEEVLIGDDIRVMLTGVERRESGKLVAKLGIAAPREMAIHRAEIAHRYTLTGGAAFAAHLKHLERKEGGDERQ